MCFQGVSGCRPGVTHDMIGHRTGSRVPSLRVSAAVRCQLWLFSGRRRHGQAWQLGRVAYKPMLQAGFSQILAVSVRAGASGVRALQQLSRFHLLGADTVGVGMPLCPPTGSGRNELTSVVEHAPVAIMGLVIKVFGDAGVATSQS